jgi:NAD(P)-dependent dehydrogenase (short-subunit alcohol dehydrogenase family)
VNPSGGVAIVTGGGGLLGGATARALAEAGCTVVVADLQPGRAADRFHFVETDVRDEASVEGLMARAAELGPLRVVVNCAGTGFVKRILSKDGVRHDVASFREMVEQHMVGSFIVTACAAELFASVPELEDGERGVIIYTASLAGLEGSAGQSAYGAAKAGVAGLTLPAARDLAAIGVRVVTIAPGGMATPDMVDLDDPRIAGVLAGVAHPKRFGLPEDYAALVMHLVANPYLNGSVFRLDGGARLGLKQ